MHRFGKNPSKTDNQKYRINMTRPIAKNWRLGVLRGGLHAWHALALGTGPPRPPVLRRGVVVGRIGPPSDAAFPSRWLVAPARPGPFAGLLAPRSGTGGDGTAPSGGAMQPSDPVLAGCCLLLSPSPDAQSVVSVHLGVGVKSKPIQPWRFLPAASALSRNRLNCGNFLTKLRHGREMAPCRDDCRRDARSLVHNPFAPWRSGHLRGNQTGKSPSGRGKARLARGAVFRKRGSVPQD